MASNRTRKTINQGTPTNSLAMQVASGWGAPSKTSRTLQPRGPGPGSWIPGSWGPGSDQGQPCKPHAFALKRRGGCLKGFALCRLAPEQRPAKGRRSGGKIEEIRAGKTSRPQARDNMFQEKKKQVAGKQKQISGTKQHVGGAQEETAGLKIQKTGGLFSQTGSIEFSIRIGESGAQGYWNLATLMRQPPNGSWFWRGGFWRRLCGCIGNWAASLEPWRLRERRGHFKGTQTVITPS